MGIISLARTSIAYSVRAISIILLLTAASSVLAQAGSDKVLRVVKGSHPLDAYAIGALKLAVEQLDEGYRVEVREEQITQTRGIEELKDGRQDVMWLATNKEVENELLPIRFPLLKGLLGYRVSIINPEAQSRFNQVETLQDLRAMSFGQGQGWPDVEILRDNGLKVITTSKYENLFHMVEGGRFHGFPRGVIEPWVEIKAHRELGLAVEEHVVMVYTLPFYLFVDPNNEALARTIHRGLDLALANGSFDAYFFGHPMVKDTLAKANLKERVPFKLNNPNLPPKTPLQQGNYWLDLNAL